MKKILTLVGILLMPLSASATANRVLDGQTITNGIFTLTIPGITDTISTATLTETMSNKSMSGSSNTFTNIPASTALTGQVGVSNGGTGDSTLTTNGMLYGNGTSAVGITAAGTQYQVFQAGASGVPTVGALNLAQSAAVTGSLGLANGGTGGTTQQTAANGVLPSQSGKNGQFLTSDGTNVSWATVSVNPTLNASVGSPQAVTAAGGISLTNISYLNYVWITGSPAAVTVTATPSITAGTAIGQRLIVIGTNNTNTVKLQDEAGLAGTTLQLNGIWTGAQWSTLELSWDGSKWNEIARR